MKGSLFCLVHMHMDADLQVTLYTVTAGGGNTPKYVVIWQQRQGRRLLLASKRRQPSGLEK